MSNSATTYVNEMVTAQEITNKNDPEVLEELMLWTEQIQAECKL